MQIKKHTDRQIVAVVESGDDFLVGKAAEDLYGQHEESAILNFVGPDGKEIEILIPKRVWPNFILKLSPEDSLEARYGGRHPIDPEA